MEIKGMEACEDLAARGATHPRVTLNDIKGNVGAVFFTTADTFVEQDRIEFAKYVEPLAILTICVIVLKNGFTLLGKSAPASPENFDAEKGREFAYEDALKQAWPLMGYALRDRLHRDSADAEIYMRATGQTTDKA